MEQGSKEWVSARLGHITASRFGDVMTKAKSGGGMGKTALAYLDELIAEHMTGLPASDLKTWEMKWGNDWEPVARDYYTNRKLPDGVACPPSKLVGFVRHPTLTYVGASTDSLVGLDAINEIKCPATTKNHVRTLRSLMIPDDYIEQAQGNLWVSCRQRCDFVSFHPHFPEAYKLVVVPVPRDDEMIANIERSVTAFREVLLESLRKLGVEPLKLEPLT